MSDITTKAEDKFKKYLTVTVLVITIIAPLLYASGYLFDKGYLETFGITGEYFSHNAHEYFFKFFHIFIEIFTGAFLGSFKYFWYFVGYIFLLAIIIFLSNTGAKDLWVQKIEASKEKLKQNKTFFNFIFSSAIFLFFLSMGFVFLFLLASFYTVVVSPFEMGKEYAQENINTYKNCKVPDTTCTVIYKGKKRVLSGLFIAKSDKYIAIWDGQKSVIYPLNGEIIVIKKSKSQKTEKASDK